MESHISRVINNAGKEQKEDSEKQATALNNFLHKRLKNILYHIFINKPFRGFRSHYGLGELLSKIVARRKTPRLPRL